MTVNINLPIIRHIVQLPSTVSFRTADDAESF